MVRPIITRRARVEVKRRPLERMPVRQLHPPLRGGDTVTGKLKTVLWDTWAFNQSDATDFSQNSSVPFNKGDNWNVWYDAVAARINARGGTPGDEISQSNPGADTGTITFNKESVIDLLSLADYAVCGSHLQPPYHLEQIKSRSNLNTTVGVALMNFESIQQPDHWNSAWFADMRDCQKTFWLAAVTGNCYPSGPWGGLNGYGCFSIDKYESTDRTGEPCDGSWPAGYVSCAPTDATNSNSKHTWEIDVGAANKGNYRDYYYVHMAEIWHDDLWGNYGTKMDFAIWDNMMLAPWKGTAQNHFPPHYTTSYYTAAWINFMQSLNGTGLPVEHSWANTTETVDVYTAATISHRFIEWWQRIPGTSTMRTMAQLSTSIEDAKNNGLMLAAGGHWDNWGSPNIIKWWNDTGPGVISGTDYGTWRQVWEEVRRFGAWNNFAVICGRTTGGGYLFWQPEFTDPRSYV